MGFAVELPPRRHSAKILRTNLLLALLETLFWVANVHSNEETQFCGWKSEHGCIALKRMTHQRIFTRLKVLLCFSPQTQKQLSLCRIPGKPWHPYSLRRRNPADPAATLPSCPGLVRRHFVATPIGPAGDRGGRSKDATRGSLAVLLQ